MGCILQLFRKPEVSQETREAQFSFDSNENFTPNGSEKSLDQSRNSSLSFSKRNEENFFVTMPKFNEITNDIKEIIYQKKIISNVEDQLLIYRDEFIAFELQMQSYLNE